MNWTTLYQLCFLFFALKNSTNVKVSHEINGNCLFWNALVCIDVPYKVVKDSIQ